LEAITSHLHVPTNTIDRRVADLGLPATKIGGRWRFKLSMVDAWAMKPDNDETKGETKDHG
jgi:excisionase family DNA binding protein